MPDQIEMKFNEPSKSTMDQSMGSAETSQEDPVRPSMIPAKPMPLMPAPAADILR